MSNYQEFLLPPFLLSEIPIKDGSHNDDRVWVTCIDANSIVEFICLDEVESFSSNQLQKEFDYEGEEWLGFFAVNNCEQDPSINPETLIKEAWNFFKEYMIWEDENLDLQEQSYLN